MKKVVVLRTARGTVAGSGGTVVLLVGGRSEAVPY